MRKFAVIYAIVIGAGILAMWVLFFAGGEVPEMRTSPVALAFHLFAEAATAFLLIGAGVGLARRALWARTAYLLALGMLLYTCLVSAGYFVQGGQWTFVAMFAVIIVLGAFALRGVRAEG